MKDLRILTAILLAAITSNCSALNPAEWKYQAAVSIEEGNEPYCRLDLTPEVYSVARGDLADLRLIDSKGDQIPYVLTKPVDIINKIKYAPSIINRSTDNQRSAMVTLDFGSQVIKNSIEVETSGNNFRRPVTVDGSNDNITFFTLVDRAYVFAVGGMEKNRFCRIELPANDYRYLRITVSPMGQEEKDVMINEVTAFKTERSFANRQTIEMIQTEQQEDANTSSSIYLYDIQLMRLPVNEIELDVAEDSFYRYITVEGRDYATRKIKLDSEDNRERFREVEVNWENVANDTIYRYTAANGQKHQKLVLNIPSSWGIPRYLKLVIKNYDDKPVTVRSASARMIADSMIFQAGGNSPITFYVGCETARQPVYDLRQRIGDISKIKGLTAKLGDIVDIMPSGPIVQKPIPWTEKHKVLLLSVLVLAALVLCGFILKSFKSIQNQQKQN
jgi:hypothetical protein